MENEEWRMKNEMEAVLRELLNGKPRASRFAVTSSFGRRFVLHSACTGEQIVSLEALPWCEGM